MNVFLERVLNVFLTPPIVNLRIQGVPVDCLLDTGSPVTILNPAVDRTSGTDFLIRRCENPRTSQVVIHSFVGHTPTDALVDFDISFQRERVRANGFTFAKHVPNFPRIVLGHETLVDALGGMIKMINNQNGQ